MLLDFKTNASSYIIAMSYFSARFYGAVAGRLKGR